jgi:hypothetical protein
MQYNNNITPDNWGVGTKLLKIHACTYFGVKMYFFRNDSWLSHLWGLLLTACWPLLVLLDAKCFL